MVHTAISTTINVGDWVELKKSVKGSGILIKGSRWFVQEVNPGKGAIKASNGKTGEDERVERFYFQDVTLTSQFQKGDIVQHTEDPRYIGLVVGEGQKVKVKWADGSDDYVLPSLIILFTRMVGGEQQILGEYAFKVGDRVVADFVNFKGITFTVRECYPSGMVGLTDEDGFDKSLAGCKLSVISTPASSETNQSSVISEEEAIPEPPNPEDYKTFEEFNTIYSQWLEKLWECKGEYADLIQVEEQFTSAREIWEQCYPEEEENEPESTNCVNVTDSLAWIDPRKVDTEAGTQTRYREDAQQISLYAEKMTAGEWEWEREPLPELVQDGENFYPVSGHHRIKAASMASGEDDAVQVYCRITPGTLEDAKLLAIRSDSNDYHGVPESRPDFRNRVEKFFSILDGWDTATQIRELEDLKRQPYASEQVGAIDRLLNRLKREEEGEGWSSRIVAAYLRSPRSYHTITRMIATRQTESVFRSVVSNLSNGDWIRYQDDEEIKIGRIIYLSKTTITVLAIDKTCITLNSSSPVELLRSIEVTELMESEQQPATEPTEEDEEEEAPPPPVKKSMGGGGVGGGGIQSVSQELREKAKELGLPTSSAQVMPDMSDRDRLRNASPHDVDDRPFATPSPVPDVSEYLIGFVSNIQDMNQPQIRRAIESILDWMETRGQTQNLGYLRTVINDL